jgi:ubiquinone/menaquinone biosynthesis C-methylase UbiE
MARSDRFWDKVAGKYAAQPIADQASYERKLEITRGYLGPETDLLEIGCGTGSTAILHAPFVRHIRAIDCSSKMLEIARANAAAAGVSNIDFERDEIDKADIPAETCDVALALSILHLVADREAVIAKVFAALKPGGVLVSSTMCLGDAMGYIRYVAPLGRLLGLLPLLRVFTGNELRSSIEGAGFTIEHDWQSAKDRAAFIVGRKPER